VKVFPDTLHQALSPPPAPLWLIAGPELLLRDEARRAIRQFLATQGVGERQPIDADRHFSWDELAARAADRSLFSSRKLLEVRLPSGKIGRDGAKAVGDWLAAGHDDILLLDIEEWNLELERTAWAKAAAAAGVYVPCWQVKPEKLPEWIRRRLAGRRLSAPPAAVALLAERVEGNLLAAAQEIDKLLLLYGPGQLEFEQVNAAVADSASYDAFRLAEAILNGDAASALRIAAGLERAALARPLVVAALARECSLLVQWQQLAAREGIQKAFADLRIWPARQGPLRRAAERLGPGGAQRALGALAGLDRLAKGQERGDFAIALDRLILECSGRFDRHGRTAYPR